MELSDRREQLGNKDQSAIDIPEMLDDSNPKRQPRSEDHVALGDVQFNEALVSAMRAKMETMSPSLCIYRVPEKIRKINEKAYNPNEVSLGPFHHGKQELKSMEGHKWRYMRALLSRKQNMDTCLDDCVKAVRELEQSARKCYDCAITLSSDEFVQMMVVDGCFIIELLLKCSSKTLRRIDDPVFADQGKLFSLRFDMLLLENQLPFFLLQRLFTIVTIVPVPKVPPKPLNELAYHFFKILLTGDEGVLKKKFGQPGNHFLDFVCNCYLPSSARVASNPNVEQRTIHSAEHLREAGVKFKKKATNSLLEIQFVDGVLKLPPMEIHNYSESLLRNLIALEQCSSDASMLYVTSFAFLLGGLVHSAEDVRLLRQSGILINRLSNDEEVAFLFKKLCEEVLVKDLYYAGICEQVNAYGRTRCSALLKFHGLRFPRANRLAKFAVLVVFLTIVGGIVSALSFCTRNG